jgi:hypothetical protein
MALTGESHTVDDETPSPSQNAQPTISPTVLAVAGRYGLTQKVNIDPFVIRFVGTFESPSKDVMLIVETVNELMALYLEGQIGEGVALDKIEIDFRLQENEAVTATEPAKAESGSTSVRPSPANGRALRELETTTVLLLDASGYIEISGDNQADLDKYDRERVTKIIKDFFDGVPREGLYEKLKAKGLALTQIVLQSEGTDPIVNDEDPPPSSDEDDDNSSVALVAGLIGGGIVLLAIAAALFISGRHRQRRNCSISEDLRSGSESLSGAQGGDVFHPEPSGTRVSFPGLLYDEQSQEGSLKAIKGKKTTKKKSKRASASAASWASMASGDNKSAKNKHLAPISTRDPYYGEDEDVFLSPVEL